jgi:trimeric autotransporter adhesin
MTRPAAGALVALMVPAGIALHLHAQSRSPSGSTSVTQTAYLKASNPDAADHFGCGGVLQGHTGQGVAISADGTTLAVGAPHEGGGASGINGNQRDNAVFDAGAVYVFVRNGDRWTQQAYVKASNPRSSAEFGHAVALSADGHTMVVSAFWEPSNAKGINGNRQDESIPQAGAAYVFVRRGSTWTQQAYVKASNTGEAGTADAFGDGDQFAFSIALSADGNTLAVGALTEDSAATGINGNQSDNSAQSAGAVYVFSRAGTTWSQQAYIKPANIDGGDMFGYAVALTADGDTLAVGAFDEDGSSRTINGPVDNRSNGSGAAFVFTRTGATWSQQAYIKPSNGEPQDSFGVHVALSDDGSTMLVGSLDEDCNVTGVNAAPCDSDQKEDVSMGAAYVFVRSGTTWSQQAFIKPSNTGFNDWFGSRVALSGDGNVAAIGASLEDSAATGIDGNQKDDSATEAGAAYLFTRTGTTWQQQAYIKGSNTEAYDEFGSSLALDRAGRTLIISARGEDGGGSGEGGKQTDNSVDEAGAVYVFRLNR